MTIFAPYCYNWSAGSSEYAIPDLKTAVSKLKMTAATSAFVIGDGRGGVWDQVNQSIADLKAFVDGGGFLILSCGGASGPDLESSCTEEQEYDILKKLLNETGCKALDFDVEGGAIGAKADVEKRNRIIARLQKEYPGLYVSFTLAVQQPQWGALPASALELLKDAKSKGVSVNVVNAMVMDLYAPMTKSWGQIAIDIMESMKDQIAPIFTDKSDNQLYGMLGATFMAG